ncbi:RTC4-like domain-containing protein [Rutstroemia sp. NJR-2017a BBW]|nr:RTC4-like domain-containing protein [Rutstroemia sp. NJR-2017a BBW]
MFPLHLDDSKKFARRRQGLSRSYPVNLLQKIKRPSAVQEPAQMSTKAGARSQLGENSQIHRTSTSNGFRSQKSDARNSDKENRSSSPACVVGETQAAADAAEEDVFRMPDSDSDSDEDKPLRPSFSSDDESPSKISADMTKTLGVSKRNNRNTETIQSSPNSKARKSLGTQSTESRKRKSGESSSKHDPKLDIFGDIKTSKKSRVSYTKTHKEPKFPKPMKHKTTYKKSPVKAGFKKYESDSEPSLVGDDEDPKFQHVSLENSPTKASPTKSGFKIPGSPNDSMSDNGPAEKLIMYGVDDDLSDAESPTNPKRDMDKEPPATQFIPFIRYDDDDDVLEGAQELVKKLKPEVSASSLASHSENDFVDLGPRCPMCNEPVNEQDLKAFGEMNTRKQEKFCRSHQKKTAHTDWRSKGYPDIDWSVLDSRIEEHYVFIKKLIGGAPSHYRSLFDERVKSGKDRNLLKSSSNLTPGYYGSRGLRMMSENIMNKFTPLLKERAPKDRLIAARSPTAFVEAVVVPELTVLLIMDDMKVADEEARDILKESSELGDLVNEEIKDVVKKRVENSDDENDEDDHEHF